LNPTRPGVGFEITQPLPVLPVFAVIAELGDVAAAEMWEVFNMGCGFCAVVPAADAERAVALLADRHPGTAVIGRVTDADGRIRVPGVGIEGEGGRIRAV
jgi:phosphoribosylformylglycinamidine cyclo-ligase